MMEIQNFYCEVCKKAFHIEYELHTDAYSVILQMDCEHKEYSPDCENGYRGLRIFDQEIFDIIDKIYNKTDSDVKSQEQKNREFAEKLKSQVCNDCWENADRDTIRFQNTGIYCGNCICNKEMKNAGKL